MANQRHVAPVGASLPVKFVGRIALSWRQRETVRGESELGSREEEREKPGGNFLPDAFFLQPKRSFGALLF